MHLNCTDLVKKYNDKKVVDKVSIDLHAKKVIGLLGPNGAGKTTTFYMLVGLIKCNSGLIKINDTDITNLPMHLRSNLGISYLPQEPSIFRNLNVRDNIMAILETRKHLSLKQRQIKLDSLVSTLQIENILNSNENKDLDKIVEKYNPTINQTKNASSKFFSYIIVFVISFVALIILIDTLKTPLINIFPGLEAVLISLFEMLKDIKLFIIDLY